MTHWNWTQPDWPRFTWDAAALVPYETRFALEVGQTLGVFERLGDDDQRQALVAVLSEEALKTSEIEGELLDRDSMQSSIRRQLGLAADKRRAAPAEEGAAQMTTEVYRRFADPLDHATLHRWHGLLMAGRTDLLDVGRYRTHPEAMQIVSGPDYKPRVHFEAPPSAQVPEEMAAFIVWFNAAAPDGGAPLAPLARAGVAHLYFESIHPYEDGNGRIGRAISEKALAQGFGRPSLIALAQTIEQARKAYYAALQAASRSNAVTEWLIYFAETALAARRRTEAQVRFLAEKTRFFDRFRDQVNPRQEKALTRLFRAGPEGFEGGLSAKNYQAITGASSATATRDLADLAAKGALRRTGERRYARYWLPLETGGSAPRVIE